MKLIDRYIGTTVLRAAGIVAVVAVALSVVSSFLGEADNFAGGSYTVLQLIAFVLLKVPEHLHEVIPVVALLGALLGLGGLAAGSELVVVRASGVSIARLGWSVARAGLVMAVATVILSEWVAPTTARLAEHSQIAGGERVQSIEGGLWLREDRRTVRVDRILAEDVLSGITVYRSGAEGGLESVLRAEVARFAEGEWTLRNVRVSRFGDEQVRVQPQEQMAWDVALQPSYLRLSVTKPEELSSLGLYRYSNYLRRNDVAAGPYRLAMWRNLTGPVTVLVLTVLALPFAFGALRGAGAGQRLFVGGLAGLVFFMGNEIAISSSQVYGLPAWLAATWPTALLALAGVIWLRRMR